MTDLFHLFTSPGALQAAWKRVSRNQGGPGGDGVTIREFSDHLGVRLERLSQQLRAGSYHPGPLRRVQIAKKRGGKRQLSIPCVADRVAQAAVADGLGPLLEPEMEDASYAYRPGRSVQQAVRRIEALRNAGYEWVVEADIRQYFDSVPHDQLLARLRQSISDRRIIDLIALWLSSAEPDGRGLPQGSPLSPLLANLYLDSMDESLEVSGCRLVRFADDFVVLCRSEAKAAGVLVNIQEALSRLGLHLHPEKTRIVSFEEGFRFLGRLFVRSLVLEQTGDTAESWDDGAAMAAAPPFPASSPTVEAHRPARLSADSDCAPVLRVLYVSEPGRRVALRNQSLVVADGDVELVAAAPGSIDRIEIGPACDMAPAALRHAAAEGIQVAFVSGTGACLGLLTRPVASRATLHLAQAKAVLETHRRIALARSIIEARLHNQRALLRRLNRTARVDAVGAAAKTIGRLRLKLPNAETVSQVMGIEGHAAALYWPALSQVLRGDVTLPQRRRRPPTDPVNLVLSFLASLLLRDLAVMIDRVGLHSGFSVLHAIQEGRESCALDLIEEFRAPVVESLAVTLFNGGRLNAGMFGRQDDGSAYVEPLGRKRIIAGYEDWLERDVRSPATGRTGAWRKLLQDQVEAYAIAINDDTAYAPYRMDY